MRIVFLLLCGLVSGWTYCQNVGIGTLSPSEKLEVSGRIYTNEGGIVFPDQTVQTTAAYNSTVESIVMPRGIGFIKFFQADLAGPLDTLGLDDVSMIFTGELDINNSGGGGGGGGNPVFGDYLVAKLNDKISHRLLKYVSDQTVIPEVRIYLSRESPGGPEIYYETKLTSVRVSKLAPSLLPGKDGGYAHTETVGLKYITITFHDLDLLQCYCWDIMSNTGCGCP